MHSGSSCQNQSKSKIRIGTRTSNLALAQVKEVISRLENAKIDAEFEIVPINTSGDKIQDRNLAELGGKGLFIKELEEAIICQKIDIAVHSAKDVPPIIHPQTEIVAFTKRCDIRDCMISNRYFSLADLPNSAIVGTSSARRKAFLLKLRPDLQIIDFRGNIDTRLIKLSAGKVDAIILAVAGIKRLGKEVVIKTAIEADEMLPAGGQGSLAIQALKNNSDLIKQILCINHPDSQICIKSERAFLRELEASCFTPVGVNASILADKILLKTAIIDYDGKEIFETQSSCEISLKNGINLGIDAAKKTKQEANSLLKRIIKTQTQISKNKP